VGRIERFDAVVLTVHSDEALALLSQPSEVEWDPWSRPDLLVYR
jgi:predicted NAD/FAD-binding protein